MYKGLWSTASMLHWLLKIVGEKKGSEFFYLLFVTLFVTKKTNASIQLSWVYNLDYLMWIIIIIIILCFGSHNNIKSIRIFDIFSLCFQLFTIS